MSQLRVSNGVYFLHLSFLKEFSVVRYNAMKRAGRLLADDFKARVKEAYRRRGLKGSKVGDDILAYIADVESHCL